MDATFLGIVAPISDTMDFKVSPGDQIALLGLLVAIVAGLLALKSYLSSSISSDLARVHDIFRDYLKIRMDFAKNDLQDKEYSQFKSEITSFNLYTMEEIFH